MDRPTTVPLLIGAWRVDPALGQIFKADESVRLDARTMRLLIYLAARAGEVVSSDELLEHVWNGVVVTQDSVYQGIAALRRLLNDDARNPAYIATVPRLGYRLVATVSPCINEPLAVPPPAQPVRAASQPDPVTSQPDPVTSQPDPVTSQPDPAGVTADLRSSWRARVVPALVSLAVAIGALVLANRYFIGSAPAHSAAQTAGPPARSVAVLPFLDLTSETMSEEYFADGMTEALIDRLSQIPGIRVPAPASSFYYKNKRTPIADIARSLGVVYVLSGSIRQADDMLRIAVRLVRADDGYVIWTRSYDRPAADKLKVQDDIATEVSRALKASIG